MGEICPVCGLDSVIKTGNCSTCQVCGWSMCEPFKNLDTEEAEGETDGKIEFQRTGAEKEREPDKRLQDS